MAPYLLVFCVEMNSLCHPLPRNWFDLLVPCSEVVFLAILTGSGGSLQTVFSSILEKVFKRIVINNIMWLFFPRAIETERRIGLPQMTGKGPAVGIGKIMVVCISVSPELNNLERRLDLFYQSSSSSHRVL